MTDWEYLTKAVPSVRSDLQTQLDYLGARGWDLVGILENNILIFKRPFLSGNDPRHPEFRRSKNSW